MLAERAAQAGIAVDRDHPVDFNGTPRPSITPDRISLGDAVGRHILGCITPRLPGSGMDGFRFESVANFTHGFFKPLAVTFDYTGMDLYVTDTVPDAR